MTVETFEGRFLAPALTWLFADTEPGPGYSVATVREDATLYRNGECVGTVMKIVFDRSVIGFWVHYRSWRGSPLDSMAVQEAARPRFG